MTDRRHDRESWQWIAWRLVVCYTLVDDALWPSMNATWLLVALILAAWYRARIGRRATPSPVRRTSPLVTVPGSLIRTGSGSGVHLPNGMGFQVVRRADLAALPPAVRALALAPVVLPRPPMLPDRRRAPARRPA